MDNPTGIDIARRQELIEAVVRKHFAWPCQRAGLDLDDFRQDVQLKLLQLDRGARPFDPSRARTNVEAQAYGYVLMVASGVYAKKARSSAYRAGRMQELVGDQVAASLLVGAAGRGEWWRLAQ